jgi:hypothetical protein
VGDQAFSFIGSAQFSAEGQIRYGQIGSMVRLEVNVSLASDADMRIYILHLDGALLGAEDFIL